MYVNLMGYTYLIVQTLDEQSGFIFNLVRQNSCWILHQNLVHLILSYPFGQHFGASHCQNMLVSMTFKQEPINQRTAAYRGSLKKTELRKICFSGLQTNAKIPHLCTHKGPFLYSVRIQGWVGGPENGNFPLLYVVKLSLRRQVGGSEKPQNTLT